MLLLALFILSLSFGEDGVSGVSGFKLRPAVLLSEYPPVKGDRSQSRKGLGGTCLKSAMDHIITVYRTSTEQNPIMIDMITLAFTTAISDLIAQSAERSQDITSGKLSYDLKRVARFALFGFLDGAVGNLWCHNLDKVVKGSSKLALVAKVIADMFVYTPLWAVFFITTMSLLKGIWRIEELVKELRSQFLELFGIDVGFYLPVNLVVYGLVPLNRRVAVFGLASVVYSTILSLWNEQKRLGNEFVDLVASKVSPT